MEKNSLHYFDTYRKLRPDIQIPGRIKETAWKCALKFTTSRVTHA